MLGSLFRADAGWLVLGALMLLDLRGFRGGVDELARQFPPEAFGAPGKDFRVVAPVSLTARVTKDAQKVRLAGRVTATLEVDCSRCLEPFSIDVDAPFDLMFLPEAPAAGATDEREVREDDIGVSIYRDDTIDLGEVMREQFYLALPMKPLCQPDCKGLCSECGTNRNRQPCDCRSDWVDPRMAALKKLLD
jgi:uncharacterized protein